jgi:hypothetical protein
MRTAEYNIILTGGMGEYQNGGLQKIGEED